MPDLKMPRLNRVIIAGRLTRDPELVYIGSDKIPLCKLGFVYSEKRKNKDDAVLFCDVSLWRAAGEYAADHLKKGYPVLVEGRLEGSEWVDKQTGATRRAINISAFSVDALTWENANGGADSKNLAGGGDNEPEVTGEDIPF